MFNRRLHILETLVQGGGSILTPKRSWQYLVRIVERCKQCTHDIVVNHDVKMEAHTGCNGRGHGQRQVAVLDLQAE